MFDLYLTENEDFKSVYKNGFCVNGEVESLFKCNYEYVLKTLWFTYHF